MICFVFESICSISFFCKSSRLYRKCDDHLIIYKLNHRKIHRVGDGSLKLKYLFLRNPTTFLDGYCAQYSRCVHHGETMRHRFEFLPLLYENFPSPLLNRRSTCRRSSLFLLQFLSSLRLRRLFTLFVLASLFARLR